MQIARGNPRRNIGPQLIENSYLCPEGLKATKMAFAERYINLTTDFGFKRICLVMDKVDTKIHKRCHQNNRD